MNRIVLTLLSFILCSNQVLTARDRVLGRSEAESSIELNKVDRMFSTNLKQYRLNMKGVEEYMEQEVMTQESENSRLIESYRELKDQENFAEFVGGVPAVVGLVTFVVGVIILPDSEDENRFDSEAEKTRATQSGARLMLYGAGGMALGWGMHELFRVKEHQVEGFLKLDHGLKVSEQRSKHSPAFSFDRSTSNSGRDLSLGLAIRF